MMRTTIIIPARYASTRFPGKPLQILKASDGTEKTLIQRSWEAAMAVSGEHDVVVATDDQRIAECVRRFGGDVVMTSESCANGTERCADAVRSLPSRPDVVVNLQGDAPMTPPWFVEALIAAMHADATLGAATPVLRCDQETLGHFLEDRRNDRVGGTTAVFGATGHALYFSKEVIPFVPVPDIDPCPVFHHVGVYAYRTDVLEQYPAWGEGPLEKNEGLEQLRFLENGRTMKCVEVDAQGRLFWELNNPEDIERIEGAL